MWLPAEVYQIWHYDNTWEHALIQRMHVNHDQYLTDAVKIAYAESQLTISKRASILMMSYWKDDICTIFTFVKN